MKGLSAFLDMKRCKNWAHNISSWKYLYEELFCQFSRAQSASFLISTLNSLWGLLKVTAAAATHDLILVEVDGKCSWPSDNLQLTPSTDSFHSFLPFANETEFPQNQVPLPSLRLTSLSKALFPFLSCICFPQDLGVSKEKGGGGLKQQDLVGPSWVQKPHCVPYFLCVEKDFSLLGLS